MADQATRVLGLDAKEVLEVTTCPICRKEIEDTATWTSPLDDDTQAHVECVDMLAATVLRWRRGNAYARTVFESVTESTRYGLVREGILS